MEQEVKVDPEEQELDPGKRKITLNGWGSQAEEKTPGFSVGHSV